MDCLRRISPVKICVEYQTQKEVSEDYFVFEKKSGIYLISGIKKRRDLNLEERNRITGTLMGSRPVYREFKDLDDSLQFLESGDGLGVPVEIHSHGPTREDKIISVDFD